MKLQERQRKGKKGNEVKEESAPQRCYTNAYEQKTKSETKTNPLTTNTHEKHKHKQEYNKKAYIELSKLHKQNSYGNTQKKRRRSAKELLRELQTT